MGRDWGGVIDWNYLKALAVKARKLYLIAWQDTRIPVKGDVPGCKIQGKRTGTTNEGVVINKDKVGGKSPAKSEDEKGVVTAGQAATTAKLPKSKMKKAKVKKAKAKKAAAKMAAEKITQRVRPPMRKQHV